MRLKYPELYIRTLLTPHLGGDELAVPPWRQPTYEHIAGAFQWVMYRDVLRLENQRGPLSMGGLLHTELRRPRASEQRHRMSEAPASLILAPGDNVDLVVTNPGWTRLHLAVLDLGQDWSIQKLQSLALEPRRTGPIPLDAVLATPYDEGTDILKVFATPEVTDFDGLSLPAHQPRVAGRLRGGGPGNALEELLEAFHADIPSSRGFSVLRKAGWE
ncbi:MAG TPA: hypothetical protein VGF67_21265 [Ktedonobacteraceae bacterium]